MGALNPLPTSLPVAPAASSRATAPAMVRHPVTGRMVYADIVAGLAALQAAPVPCDLGEWRVITPFHKANARWDDAAAAYALFAQRHGIPTGQRIPVRAARLVADAHALTPRYVGFTEPSGAAHAAHAEYVAQRDLLLTQARAIIAGAEVVL